MSGAGAAAGHLTAMDPITLALLAPQVTVATAERRHHRPSTPSDPFTPKLH